MPDQLRVQCKKTSTHVNIPGVQCWRVVATLDCGSLDLVSFSSQPFARDCKLQFSKAWANFLIFSNANCQLMKNGSGLTSPMDRAGKLSTQLPWRTEGVITWPRYWHAINILGRACSRTIPRAFETTTLQQRNPAEHNRFQCSSVPSPFKKGSVWAYGSVYLNLAPGLPMKNSIPG